MRRWKKTIIALVLALSATAFTNGTIPEHTDTECLASAIHYEAGGEPLAGKRAVYEVIMNRARMFRQTLCEVIKSPNQFSWYPRKPILPVSPELQETLDKVEKHPDILRNENYRNFFSGSIIPAWAVNMQCRVIYNQKFCKEKT